ncbi:butyrate kinase [Erysipelothrix larvae]|uniref:Probable butyrate kinase n=1 Tax=Erysipelothrix larvae TaxID=1514105 RepID=A0A120JTK0_9FIRM|nr:butyrate kinase [Erysipelothrix larvae]AMC93105.1 butyrate kinase [Erysipelothrix larvae]
MTLILSINPGATSTKFGLFDGYHELFKGEVPFIKDAQRHTTLIDQLVPRYDAIYTAIKDQGYDPQDIEVAVGRGGILPPVEAGALLVDQHLIDYLLSHAEVVHPANLGASIAQKFVDQAHQCVAYIYDPISVDQMIPLARFSGVKEIERKSIGHILNSRQAAMHYAQTLGKSYHDVKVIVVHAGTGITLTAHSEGRMIDLISDDEGPFSPERSGGLPLRKFMAMCYNNSEKDMIEMTRHSAGLVSYLGTNDVRKVEAFIDNGDQYAHLVLEAMAYQISKSIASLGAVLYGNIDGIIITGGFARSKRIIDWIKERVAFLGEVIIYPGEFEIEALAFGGYRAYLGEEEIHTIKR